MAISFSRPDPSSPAAVAEASFGTARRGFDQQEVRDFLRMVSAELGRLQERERFLERELTSARTTPDLESLTIDEETAARLLGEETTRILAAARESAASIKARAEEGASRLLREATDEANRARQDAELEAARRRSDAASDAETELAMAKQQGREMVEEARAYRERVLGELNRRREMARRQIEQLVGGRDRLVQAFERARLVAADVVSELAPLEQPAELVDLSPTTGPVPLTIPRSPGDQSAVSDTPMPGEAAGSSTDAIDDDEPDNPFVRDATGAVPVPDRADSDTEVEAAEAEAAGQVIDDVVMAVDVAAAAEPGDLGDAAATDTATSNVVAFPVAGEVTTPSGEPAESGDPDRAGDAHDDAAAADVDQIFARLRAGRGAPSAPAAPAASVDDGGADAPTTGDAAPDSPFAAREVVIVPLIVAAGRKLKRRLADEQNEVLDALRRNEPLAGIASLVGDEPIQIDRYADAITSDLAAAASAGAAAIGGSEEIDVGSAQLLGPAREAIASELVAPLRERLRRAVEEADGDHDVVAKKVRGLYREWKSQRIDDELDDIVRGVYARAAYASLAPGTTVCWLVDPDGPASPDCEDNSLATPVTVGEPFPTGHPNPPAYPGCRCLHAVVED
ncbi:MAG: DivIVA domain-containing protein [Desertimonas sp.]